MDGVIQIALTGGIAAGKSVVSRRLAEHGAVVIDADVLAREVVEPGMPALEAVRERFGEEVIAPGGTLNRPALGAIVFADDAARLALNAIMHPAIRALRDETLGAIAPDSVVVHDIPLLVEGGADPRPLYDHVVVVHAELDERIRRMVEDRGMTREEAQRRISAQATEDQRLAVATTVIDNTGTLDATLRQVDALWESLAR